MDRRTVIVALAALAIARPAPAGAQVSGTATYLVRMALPPQAVFEASLEDVTTEGAPPEVVQSVTVPNPGNPPIRFSIDVDPKRIDQAHRYAVRATIAVDGRVILGTDRPYPVLTQGNGATVALTLFAGPAQRPAPTPAPFGQLPASFSGDLPCADCEGIRYRLNLFSDRAFYLSLAYLGKTDDTTTYDIGTWMLSSNRRVLVLMGGRESSSFFRVVDATTIRKLDLEGRDITSALNYTLTRTPTFARIEPKLPVRGVFRYMADAGLFTECSTGQRWPVAQDADNATLEREYGKVRSEPGGPVMVRVDGRVAMRPKVEGSGLEPALVVERFISASPGGTCGPRPSAPPLEKTSWTLTRVGDAAVLSTDPKREAGLTFDPVAMRVSGSGGCNRISGAYTRTGLDGLRFGPVVGTMMACADGMDTEAALLTAMPRVRTWNILGSILELYDEAGALVARLEARHPAAPQ